MRPMQNERTLVAEPEEAPELAGVLREPAAADLCAARGLRGQLATAAGLVKRHFAGVTELRREVLEARETDERWVLLRFRVAGSADDAVAAYERFEQNWVEQVPWPERDRIRFVFEPA